jgi:hypothetical protein
MALGLFIKGINGNAVSIPQSLNAGPDQTVNSGDVVLLAANQPGTWTTTGTGTFDDNGISNPVYTPSVHDLALGSITMTLTVGTTSDSVIITFAITEAYLLAEIPISHFWHADDATDTAGNLTAWVDRKAGVASTNIGTPTVTANAIDGHKTVNFDGSASGLSIPRIAFKSISIGMKYTASGSRILHVPSSNISTNFHAGIFMITGSNTLTVGMSGDNHRNDYYLTTPEKDADVADNVFYDYSFRDIVHFRRNMKTCYPVHETTTVDTSSTATNMFLCCRRRGDNTSTADQFAKASIPYIILSTTAWTQDQTLIVGRFVAQNWPTVQPEDTQYLVPLAAERFASGPLDSGHSSGGGAGNFYPPGVVKTTEFYIMAKAANNTGCMIQSNDSGVGATWVEVAGAKIDSTATAAFNGTYAYRDGAMYYDGSTFHNWFVARNNVGVESIGYTSAATATAGRAAGTQKLTAAQVNTALSTSYTGLGSPKLRKIGTQFYLLVSAYDSTGGDIILCTMTAVDGGTIVPVKKLVERSLPYTTIYSSSVIYHLNRYIMFTHNGWFETTRNERNLVIYATEEGPAGADLFTGTYPYKSITPLLEPRYTVSGAFDEGGVYDAEVLVNNDGLWFTPNITDGNIWVFHAGVSWPVEVGLMSYCKVPQALFEIAKY